jgi:hypothetical protein
MRNLPLPELQKSFREELEREGFTALDLVKNGFYSQRNSQTTLAPKTVIVTAHAVINGMSVVGVTINGTRHYPPRHGTFSETWRRLVNESLLWDDIADWYAGDDHCTRPQRKDLLA